MNESYFKYNELCNFAGSPELYIVVCTKFLSLPNGTGSYLYQVQDERGELLRDENNNSWFNQSKLRKLHQPGEMDFKTLMDHLKNDIIERGDIN